MQSYWLKYTLRLTQEVEDDFTQAILSSSYTLGWMEPLVEVIVTQNGYDYEERTDTPLTEYVFEPVTKDEQEHVADLQQFLEKWQGNLKLEEVEQVKEENESWKDEFREIEVGDWMIAPSWIATEELPEGKSVMRIDPGAAFGTGYHVTTQDMLYYLQQMSLVGKKVVDIGVGSGILSIFSILQGANRPVYGIDNNADTSFQVTQNLALNRLPESSVEVIIEDASKPDVELGIPQQIDIVLVNIGGDEDISMLPFVKKVLRTGGMAILSGIVEWNYALVKAAYEKEGFTEIDNRQGDEWITMRLRYE